MNVSLFLARRFLSGRRGSLLGTVSSLALAGVGEQNPFLSQSVAAGRFGHYRTVEEGLAAERRASGAPFDAPSGGT